VVTILALEHCNLPDHSGLEVCLDLNWIAVLVFARANVENGEDACNGYPQGGVCHETAGTDATRGAINDYQGTKLYSNLPSSVAERRGRRIENFLVFCFFIGIQESLGYEIH
jgi:hypothetical protein